MKANLPCERLLPARGRISCLTLVLVFLMSHNMTVAAALEPELVHLANPACEADISIKPFVRLISFRLAGGRSHLLNYESPNPLINGKPSRPTFVAGAKFWYAPEVAGSHLFGMLAGVPTQTERSVQVQLDPDPGSKLQGTIRYVLDERLPRLTISSTLRNVGTAVTETSCWWPVAFEPGGRMEADVIPLPTEPFFRFLFWSYGAPPSEPACRIGQGRSASIWIIRSNKSRFSKSVFFPGRLLWPNRIAPTA